MWRAVFGIYLLRPAVPPSPPAACILQLLTQLLVAGPPRPLLPFFGASARPRRHNLEVIAPASATTRAPLDDDGGPDAGAPFPTTLHSMSALARSAMSWLVCAADSATRSLDVPCIHGQRNCEHQIFTDDSRHCNWLAGRSVFSRALGTVGGRIAGTWNPFCSSRMLASSASASDPAQTGGGGEQEREKQQTGRHCGSPAPLAHSNQPRTRGGGVKISTQGFV